MMGMNLSQNTPSPLDPVMNNHNSNIINNIKNVTPRNVGLLPSPPNLLPQIPFVGYMDNIASNQINSESVLQQQIISLVGGEKIGKREEEKEKRRREEGRRFEQTTKDHQNYGDSSQVQKQNEKSKYDNNQDREVNNHHHTKKDNKNKEAEILKTPSHKRHHHDKITNLTPTLGSSRSQNLSSECTEGSITLNENGVSDRKRYSHRKHSSVSPYISGCEQNKGMSSTSPSIGTSVSDVVSNAVYDNAGGSCSSSCGYSGSGCSCVSPDLSAKVCSSGNDKSESDSGFSSLSGSDWDSFSERSDMSKSDSGFSSRSVSPLLENKKVD
jgi:hypothetical protein